MAWLLTDALDRYADAAGRLLLECPAENTIMLGATATLRSRGMGAFGSRVPPLFGWWPAPDGRAAAAFLHTPPYPVALTSMPAEAAAALAVALAARQRPVSGVNADERTAQEFAAAWRDLTGDQVQLQMRSRLYRLGRLMAPDPAPPGQARVAGPADRELLRGWSEAFHHEAGTGPADVTLMLDDRLSYGGFTLWEAAGQPVAMAGLTRQVAGHVRVGPVYTPPGHRGRGYGGAVTCAVSQSAVDAGVTDVLLFTDLANPTSNALYQRLGYRRLSDRAVWSFTPAPS